MFRLFKLPFFHIALLMVALGIVFCFSHIRLLDDGYYYQRFAEALVDRGRVDFSIPGFHGASFFAAAVYALTGSHNAIALSEMLFALLAVPAAYFGVRELFKSSLLGVFAAYLVALMPFVHFTSLRGWTYSSMTFFVFVTLYLLGKGSRWAWIPWGIAMLIKPFPIVLAPLFFIRNTLVNYEARTNIYGVAGLGAPHVARKEPKAHEHMVGVEPDRTPSINWFVFQNFKELLLGLLIPTAYVALQFFQTGSIMIGAHQGLTTERLIDLARLPLNVAFAFQNYLSVHAYTPFNPVGIGDMAHISPLMTMLAFLSVAHYSVFFPNRRLFFALLAWIALGLVIPASFYYYDRYYFIMFEYGLIILALPACVRYPLFVPVVAASYGFQFFYFYLSHQVHFWPDGSKVVFVLPVIAGIAAVGYALAERKRLFV